MGTRLRELMKTSRDLEDKASSNQASALELLRMGEQLQQTVENMKTFRETLTEVHGGPHDRHLPQIEEAYLQQLQRENAALRAALEEHQATLEMIMSTYRQQVCALIRDSKVKVEPEDGSEQELYVTKQRMYEMAHVMAEAVAMDDQASLQLRERVAQLEFENKSLREMLDLANQATVDPYSGWDTHSVHTETHSLLLPTREGSRRRSKGRSSSSEGESPPASLLVAEVDISHPSQGDEPMLSLEDTPPGDEGVDYAIQQIDKLFSPWAGQGENPRNFQEGMNPENDVFVEGALAKGPGSSNQVLCLAMRTDARQLVLDDN